MWYVFWIQVALIFMSAAIHYGRKKFQDKSLTVQRWLNDDAFSGKGVWVGVLSGLAFSLLESLIYYLKLSGKGAMSLKDIFTEMSDNSYTNITGLIISTYVFGYVLMVFNTKVVPIWTQAVGMFLGFLAIYAGVVAVTMAKKYMGIRARI